MLRVLGRFGELLTSRRVRTTFFRVPGHDARPACRCLKKPLFGVKKRVYLVLAAGSTLFAGAVRFWKWRSRAVGRQLSGLFRLRPHHHVLGFLAAVTSIEAFVQVGEVDRRPRQGEAHVIATASGAGPSDREIASGRIGLVRMWHGPQYSMHGLNFAPINARELDRVPLKFGHCGFIRTVPVCPKEHIANREQIVYIAPSLAVRCRSSESGPIRSGSNDHRITTRRRFRHG
jgi:hypothetical protein